MREILVDLDSVMKPCKPYADGTLQNMKKSELIEYVRMLEHNNDVAVAALNQQAENVKDWEPVVRAHWETVPNRVLEHGEVEIRGTAERCSSCMHASKDFKKWFDRCPNCGAKMDGEEEQC